MGSVAILFAGAMSCLGRRDTIMLPDLFAGMAALWQPIILLILQVLWGSVFVLFGKSMVTSVEIHFRLTKIASSQRRDILTFAEYYETRPITL